MKYIVACLMAFGFYGLTFGQTDTTGAVEEPSLTCYMMDESTFLCTTEEDVGADQQTEPGTEEDILYEEEGTGEETDIQRREEDYMGEPETEEEIPMEPERESDEGILPESGSEDTVSDQNQNQEEPNVY